MKLYYAPGACSLSPHIVLREAGFDITLEKVNLRTTWEPVFCFEAAAFGTSLNNADFLLNSALEKLTLTALETKAELENVVNEEKW